MTDILFIGDIVGKSGRRAVKSVLPKLIESRRPDFIIANVENLAHGFGVTRDTLAELSMQGIDCFTSGNHIYDKNDAFALLEDQKNLLRPLNYPPDNPGTGTLMFTLNNGKKLLVANVLGRALMPPADCPFRTFEKALEKYKNEADIVVVDFHGEATAEKACFANYFDGKINAVIGTHTHVQTADNRTLPGGTAFISDAGMVGAEDSIIGVEKEEAISRMLTGINNRFNPAKGKYIFCGAMIHAESAGNNTLERLLIREGE